MHLRAQGLSEGDEHPTNTPHGVWYSFWATVRKAVGPMLSDRCPACPVSL